MTGSWFLPACVAVIVGYYVVYVPVRALVLLLPPVVWVIVGAIVVGPPLALAVWVLGWRYMEQRLNVVVPAFDQMPVSTPESQAHARESQARARASREAAAQLATTASTRSEEKEAPPRSVAEVQDGEPFRHPIDDATRRAIYEEMKRKYPAPPLRRLVTQDAYEAAIERGNAARKRLTERQAVKKAHERAHPTCAQQVRSDLATDGQLRWRIFARDAYTCRACGATGASVELTVDHIVPVSRGGTNVESNLQTLCRSCNSRKGARVA